MSKKYFARIDGRQCGPFELERLAEAGVTPDTYIWCKGMDDWQLARDNGEVCRMFRQRLFDLMHPTQPEGAEQQAENDDDPYDSVPIAFRRYVERSGTTPGEPSENRPDTSTAPPNMLFLAIVVALMCFPLTGVLAIYFSYATNKLWRAGKRDEAYDMARRAKMWIGITFFVGILANALLLQMRGLLM